MFVLLSPAKRLDFSAQPAELEQTTPALSQDAAILARRTRRYSRRDLRRLMNISEDLSDLNHRRFQAFDLDGKDGTKQAVLAFNGDVYAGLDAKTLSKEDLAFAQKRLGILSGLYGLLRPLDAIQPYRLEMGTKVNTRRGEDLYDFWRDKLTKHVNGIVVGLEALAIVNLASNEYFSAVNEKKLKVPVVHPVFKEIKDGNARVIGILAKKARGLMARHIIANHMTDIEGMKDFRTAGYRFNPAQSEARRWVFEREAVQAA